MGASIGVWIVTPLGKAQAAHLRQRAGYRQKNRHYLRAAESGSFILSRNKGISDERLPFPDVEFRAHTTSVRSHPGVLAVTCVTQDGLLREIRATMHVKQFFEEVGSVAKLIDVEAIERLAQELASLRERGGRLFLLGVGGSAANCSHAVNDFRKLCGIEAYTPVDNVAELTARTNDEGWDTVFSGWLRVSKASEKDAVFVFSVGGGNLEKRVSTNIVSALQEAKSRRMKIMGVVGRDGGYTKQVGDVVVVIPTVEASRVTPHTEAFQAVVWHCLVSHPALQQQATKW